MKKIFFILIVMMFASISLNAYALIVETKSVSSGTYEDGVFTPSDSGFKGKYTIDEDLKKVTLVEVIENNREGRIEKDMWYEITNISVSEGLSALLVAKNKKGQKIVTAVREGSLGASELIMIGENFYQYLKAANGKFYLEYGKVTRER